MIGIILRDSLVLLLGILFFLVARNNFILYKNKIYYSYDGLSTIQKTISYTLGAFVCLLILIWETIKLSW